MAAEGAGVAVVGLPPDRTEAVAAELKRAGRRAIGIPADVSDAAALSGAFERTMREFGRIDIVVPNAGIQLHNQDVDLHELPDEVWDRTHAVNYRGVYLTCKYALRHFVALGNGGVIVIVASVTGLNGRSANPSYMTGKTGLLGLGRYIAVHYAKHGVRCNTICPGALELTPNHDLHPDPEGRRASMQRRIPLGRLATPADIAPWITFLASDDAAYATGANFVVDGGLTIA
jgi:3-oxoacyl-[acyl-carrier protein] reductase